jgi:LPXTG-motif cell wall-anchored protein
MQSVRKRIGAGMLTAGLVALGLGLLASPSYAVVPNPNDCLSHLSSAQQGNLDVATAPSGTVPAGSDVRVEATWHTPDWLETDKILVCPTTDGIFDSRLAGGQRPMTNDGAFTWYFTIPSDMPVGSEICVKDVLQGRPTGAMATQISDTECFRTAAALPVTTTTTMTPTTTDNTVTNTTGDANPGVSPDVEPSGAGAGGDVVLSQPATQPAPMTELPRTGSGSGALVLAGALAVLVGGFLVGLGRRRSAGSQA